MMYKSLQRPNLASMVMLLAAVTANATVTGHACSLASGDDNGTKTFAHASVGHVPSPSYPTDANVVGHIKDKNTGEHLPYATVTAKGTNIAVMTDATGHYYLKNLPEGTYTLEVRLLGYETASLTVTVVRDKTLEVNFSLAEDNMSLDEVVVSSNRGETRRRLAPNLVSVVGSGTFHATQSACLAEGLGFQPGVRTEDDCQNCGFAQVRINGLDGHYSQILIDSRPVFSSLNGVYGLEQIPANMIERVEVVRGGGSALFGASAVGGTINVITKEPLRNSAEISHTIRQTGGESYDNVTSASASVVSDDNRHGLFIHANNRHRQSYDHDGDGYTETPLMRNKSLGLNAFMRLTPYHKLQLQYNGIGEFRRGGNMLHLPAHEANVTEQTEHDIHNASLSYTFYSPDARHHANVYASFMSTRRDSYYGGIGSGTDEEREAAAKAYGQTRGMTWVAGALYRHSFERLLFMPSDLTVGAEYNADNLHDMIIGYDRNFRQTIGIASAYVQNEWKNERWTMLVGARADKHSLIDHLIISPRANLRYNPSRDISMRLSWSGGFRAPQAFDEDLHVGVVGGERLVTVLADGLSEERSNSYSLSAEATHRVGQVRVELLAEAFYTRLSDVFALRRLSEPDAYGNVVQERYNAYGAKVFGLNLEARAACRSWLSLQAGLTIQRSRYDEPLVWNDEVPEQTFRRMMKTPDTYGFFIATVSPVRRLSCILSGNYTGRMLVGHNAGSGTDTPVTRLTPRFMVVDAKVAYDIDLMGSVCMELSAGVKNIGNAYQKDFDRGWNRDSDYIYGPSAPRSLFASARLSF